MNPQLRRSYNQLLGTGYDEVLAKLQELISEAPPELAVKMEEGGHRIILPSYVGVVAGRGQLAFVKLTAVNASMGVSPDNVITIEKAAETLTESGHTPQEVENLWTESVKKMVSG